MRVGLTILLTFLAVICCAVDPPPDVAWFKRRLVERFAATTSVQADFVQTRHLKKLSVKITTTGDCAVEKDGRMAWHVRDPLHYLCIISTSGITQWDADTGKILTVSAKKIPWLKLVYNNFISWLTADIAEIERHYNIEVAGSQRLRLMPKDDFFKTYVTAVELEFDQNYKDIQKLILEEKSGDEILIEFRNIKRNEVIAETKWQIPPPSKNI